MIPAAVASILSVGTVDGMAQSAVDANSPWRYGSTADVAYLRDPNDPENRLFRYRGTTPRVNGPELNMWAAWLRKASSETSRWGGELTAHTGQDAKTFGFSATAPPVRGADILTHLGPTSVTYLSPAGAGLAIQGGIFNSLIGYDSLYSKDNFSYTRPWGADFTPYLMLGVNASYSFTPRVTGTFALVNGYFHLAHANEVPSVASQFAFKATDRVLFRQTVLAGPHQSNTAIRFWRTLSDTIVERRGARVVAALEYQLGAEPLDVAGRPVALWTSVQGILHWSATPSWGFTIRPEWTWDRDGRWIAGTLGAGQAIVALTTTGEYRLPVGPTRTIVRVEHRFDRSSGPGSGFNAPGARLRPQQHLLIVSAVVSVEAGF